MSQLTALVPTPERICEHVACMGVSCAVTAALLSWPGPACSIALTLRLLCTLMLLAGGLLWSPMLCALLYILTTPSQDEEEQSRKEEVQRAVQKVGSGQKGEGDGEGGRGWDIQHNEEVQHAVHQVGEKLCRRWVGG